MVRRFETDPDVLRFLRALNALRREALQQVEWREHVGTIIAMIDQYAESAIGDRALLLRPAAGHVVSEDAVMR